MGVGAAVVVGVLVLALSRGGGSSRGGAVSAVTMEDLAGGWVSTDSRCSDSKHTLNPDGTVFSEMPAAGGFGVFGGKVGTWEVKGKTVVENLDSGAKVADIVNETGTPGTPSYSADLQYSTDNGFCPVGLSQRAYRLDSSPTGAEVDPSPSPVPSRAPVESLSSPEGMASPEEAAGAVIEALNGGDPSIAGDAATADAMEVAQNFGSGPWELSECSEYGGVTSCAVLGPEGSALYLEVTWVQTGWIVTAAGTGD